MTKPQLKIMFVFFLSQKITSIGKGLDKVKLLNTKNIKWYSQYFLMVQWLRPSTSSAGGTGSSLAGEPGS